MHKIKTICVKGFRRLRDVHLDMRPLMVLIGANGVGKTSVLDAISLLSASAEGKLNATLNSMGGLADVSTRGEPKTLAYEVTRDNPPPHNDLKYNLKIVPKGQGYAIAEETLGQVRQSFTEPFLHINSHHNSIGYYNIDEEQKGFAFPKWNYDYSETTLAQIPAMFEQPQEFRTTLASATKYHVLDVGENAPVKLPQSVKPASLPGTDGESLAPFLYTLRESDSDRFEMIEDTLHAAFPEFDKLTFPPNADGRLSLAWKETSYSDPFFAHQLSEGTLRFLWLVSLLCSPHLSPITMIDEPEVSMHPELLSILVDVMREASNHTQVIIATHADRLVRFLKPEEVFVMDKEPGNNHLTTVRNGGEMDLERWLGEYTLDEIWGMGTLGGRP